VILPESQRNAKAAEEGEQQLQGPLGVLDAALTKTGYLIGNSFTVADVNVASVFAWAKMARMDVSKFSHVDKWLNAAMQRPAAVKAQPKRG
jgi:glutathione S-transferase